MRFTSFKTTFVNQQSLLLIHWNNAGLRLWCVLQSHGFHVLSPPGLSFLSPGAQTCSSLPEPRGSPRPATHTEKQSIGVRIPIRVTFRISCVGFPKFWRLRRVGSWLHTDWSPSPHTLTSASTWCSRMGLLQNSTSGLGTLRVSGRSRVPYPPTRIKAFIFSLEILARWTKLGNDEGATSLSGTEKHHSERWMERFSKATIMICVRLVMSLVF